MHSHVLRSLPSGEGKPPHSSKILAKPIAVDMALVYRASLCMLGVLVVLTVGYSWHSWYQAKQELLQRHQGLIQLGERAINENLKRKEVLLTDLAKVLGDERKMLAPLALQELLQGPQGADAELSGFGVFGLRGQLLDSPQLGRSGTNRLDPGVYVAFKEKMRKGESFFIHRPVVSQLSKRWVVHFGVPIENLRGEHKGILVATSPVGMLEAYWKSVFQNSLTQVGLLGDDGYLLSSYGGEQRSRPEEIFAYPFTRAFNQFSHVNQSPRIGPTQGAIAQGEFEPGHSYLYSRLEDYPATIFLRLPETQAWSYWWQMTWPSYLCIVFLLMGGALGLRWLAIRVEKTSAEFGEMEAVQNHLTQIVESTDDAIVSQTVQGEVLSWNKGAEQLLGYKTEEIVGHNLLKLVPQALLNEEIQLIQRVKSGETVRGLQTQRISKSGQPVELEITYTPISDGSNKVTAISCVMRDNLWRKSKEEENHRLANYDSLTGLPNRRLLQERFAQSWEAAKASQEYGALVFLDLDHFKTVNDTKGHDAGDAVLQEISKRLTGIVRSSDLVARWGGDEFVILLTGLSRNQQNATNNARALALSIQSELSRQLDFLSHSLGVSLGVSLFPLEGQKEQDVMREADTAMYTAKSSGRHQVVFFDPSMQDKSANQVQLLVELEAALPAGEFVLYLQPQHDGGGEIKGAELLLRWHHPTRGVLLPSEFMGVAESSSLIFPLGDWILDQAIRIQRNLEQEGFDWPVAINLSPRQFLQTDFAEKVGRSLRQSGVDPSRLGFEISENMLLENTRTSIVRMQEITSMGVNFTIDNFGVGFSSLAHLKNLPVAGLKIDRSLIKEVPKDMSDSAVVQKILALGQQLGFKVLAEGVETRDQQDFLQAHGCNLFQGYLYSEPLQLVEWFALQAKKAKLAATPRFRAVNS